ncbi:MAG: hypothetical protein AAGA48_01400 [Myxococcota bacterium]
MRDLDCWNALTDPERSDDELVEWLDALAELSASDRWPYFARVEALLDHDAPAVRVAALAAFEGATGLGARTALVRALDDEEDAVRAAAMRSCAVVGRMDRLLWVHGLYHPRSDVRQQTLEAMPSHAAMPQWSLLPLLGDPEVGPMLEARLLVHGLEPGSVGDLMRLTKRGGLATGLVFRCLASLDWRHQLEAIVTVFSATRNPAPTKDEPLGEQILAWRSQSDSLDELVRTIISGAMAEDPHATSIVEQWLHDVASGGALTDHERRLAISVVVVLSKLDWWPLGLALALAGFPGLARLMHPDRLWPALPHYARAVQGSLPSEVQDGLFEHVPWDAVSIDGLTGLVRLAGPNAFDTLLQHPDLRRDALVNAMVEDPDAGGRLLAVPVQTRRDKSARRTLLLDVLNQHGRATATLIAHAAVRLPKEALLLLEARPSDWGEAEQDALLREVLAALASLDRNGAIRERHVTKLARHPPFNTVAALSAVLEQALSGGFVHHLVTQALVALGSSVVDDLSGAALQRLVDLDRKEDALPWALQQEVAKALQHHGHSGIQAWAREVLAPVEVAMARLAEASPGRGLTNAELNRIKTATPKQLATALAPALSARSRGVVEALDNRKPQPSIEACLALLLSGDRLESVGRLLEDYSESTDAFWHELETRAVKNFGQDDQVGTAMAAWLWRWDRPFSVFVSWATDQAQDLAAVLARSLELPSTRLRHRLWQAVRHLCGRWRWRVPTTLVEVAHDRFLTIVVRSFDGANATSGSPRAYVASRPDFADVTRQAALILNAMVHLGIDLSAYREPVEARLGELPPRTVAELAAWLGVEPPSGTEEPPGETVEVPQGVESLTDVAVLIDIVQRGERGWAELASLRLLELPEGGRALVHALVETPGRNPAVLCQAVALVSDSDALRLLAETLADPSRPPQVRFHVALALAEGAFLDDVDCVEPAVAAMVAPHTDEARSWLDHARFTRWLAHAPSDRSMELAIALVDSPHFPAYRWAVLLLIEEPDGREIEPLRRFLRHGRNRMAKIRLTAAEALATRGDSLGAPILAARRMEQVRNDTQPFVELAPRGADEVARAGVLAGTDLVPPSALLTAVVASHVPLFERTRAALAILNDCDQEAVQREALNHLDNRHIKQRVVGRLARVVLWGRDQARDLLDRDFGVQLIGGESLGYTRLEQDRVYVNPLPLLRRERNGAAILKGLLIHELGHHLYNASREGLEVWKRAGEKKLQRLHNLVCDEHLERNLRSMKPGYDLVLKRLAAWAFLHTRTDIHVLTLIERLGMSVDRLIATSMGVARTVGCVTIEMGRLFRQLEAEGSSFARFVRALRMGLGNRHGDPLVEKGLALFGKGFRKLDNEGLWKVTLALHELFGDDVNLMDLVDLHETSAGGDGEAIPGGRGVTDEEVQGKADELQRIREKPKGFGEGAAGPDTINVGDETEFDRIETIEVLSHDPVAHARLARDVQRPASQLRAALADLGLATRPVKPRTQGHRIDRGRLVHAALRRDPRILVSRVRMPANDLFVGVCVDCSGSMGGARLERARRFATLMAEACRGLASVDLRTFGFTDSKLFDAGNAMRSAAHALRTEGGNNDAAALHHVATLARRSPRDVKLLVMISDGLPTECTSNALIGLVRRLSREGMACAQVAVAPIREPCFDHYVEVLNDETGDAVRRFGRIVQGLVATTMRARR